MKFNVITYSQCNSTPTIEVLLDDNDMKSKLYSINESILDDTYKIYYSDFISKNSRYDWVFTPYTNNLLKLLFHHNLLPHILGSKNWGELSDLTLCESHNERFRYFLSQKTN